MTWILKPKLLKQLFCGHKGQVWRLVDITWVGTSVIQCDLCGKVKHIPL